ncbi:hypothetical protein SAMN04488564_111296 [Lentzea waywayandensis]|uniref:Uncharacterized protein n=1 Tax=Lentzea waywayandensis TaxID=84724 RepID=A0A1I6FDD2_9PSEU|nr:hypothetical protein SAMN04488564_111296 [Lentzea waywayandensis]
MLGLFGAVSLANPTGPSAAYAASETPMSSHSMQFG